VFLFRVEAKLGPPGPSLRNPGLMFVGQFIKILQSKLKLCGLQCISFGITWKLNAKLDLKLI